ncbi:MAG: RHS repeat-associated core domain-containing protein [Candidatus Kapaibacterium sp.]|nr:MAG: RHS repeat-associated core domain-containing protein [Candidatus Kapabacteria bacterium]
MVVSSCHTTYAPFGSVLTTTGTGQRTGYIGREADSETGLGNYGVRLYEPEYGRFMSVDVLWGEYEGWQPYQYALNAPLSFRDEGGKWVQAMNEAAEQAIRESVPERFRSSIVFSGGVLDVSSVKAAAKGRPLNDNISILSRLAENPNEIQVTVAQSFSWKLDNKTFDMTFYSNDMGLSYDQDQVYLNPGVTLLPQKEESAESKAGEKLPVSTRGVIEVYISINSPWMSSRGKIAAHELYGHVRRYILWKMGIVTDFWHSNPGNKNGTDAATDKAESGVTKGDR